MSDKVPVVMFHEVLQTPAALEVAWGSLIAFPNARLLQTAIFHLRGSRAKVLRQGRQNRQDLDGR
jgi:hypothetical protein